MISELLSIKIHCYYKFYLIPFIMQSVFSKKIQFHKKSIIISNTIVPGQKKIIIKIKCIPGLH